MPNCILRIRPDHGASPPFSIASPRQASARQVSPSARQPGASGVRLLLTSNGHAVAAGPSSCTHQKHDFQRQIPAVKIQRFRPKDVAPFYLFLWAPTTFRGIFLRAVLSRNACLQSALAFQVFLFFLYCLPFIFITNAVLRFISVEIPELHFITYEYQKIRAVGSAGAGPQDRPKSEPKRAALGAWR